MAARRTQAPADRCPSAARAAVFLWRFAASARLCLAGPARGGGGPGLPPRCVREPPLVHDWLYVGHADAPKYLSSLRMELLADPRLPPQGEVDTLCTVVGSWSFLSLLLGLRPRRLVLFDVNPSPVAFMATVAGLLRAAPTRRGFLSYFLGRTVGGQDLRALEAEAVGAMVPPSGAWPHPGPPSPSPAVPRLLAKPLEPALVRAAVDALEKGQPEEVDWTACCEEAPGGGEGQGGCSCGPTMPSPPCAYLDFVWAYLRPPAEASAGRRRPPGSRRICDLLEAVGHPMNAPVNVNLSRPDGDPNVCSLFLSHGWMASDAAYRRVRARFLAARRHYAVLDFFRQPERSTSHLVRGHEVSVLYLSNLHGSQKAWADELEIADELRDLLQRVAAEGGYLRVLNLGRWYSFDSRPHMTALAAVRRLLGPDAQPLGGAPGGEAPGGEAMGGAPRRSAAPAGPGAGGGAPAFQDEPLPLVEVVAQDLQLHPGWGFHELERNRVVHYTLFVDEIVKAVFGGSRPFLMPAFERTCMLHVLVGEGVSREDFRVVLEVATISCRRVLVLEHNRLSKDFAGTSDDYLDPADLRDLVVEVCAMPQRFLSDCGLVALECAYGKKDHCRNFAGLVEVHGTALHAAHRPAEPRAAAGGAGALAQSVVAA